jgi:hypothetical protein
VNLPRWVLHAACIALLSGGAAGVQAHQLKAALTTIALNPRTETVEIIHRFYLHDAEHAVEQLGGMRGDIVRDAALQEAFARYVFRQFRLADATGADLPLDLVGAEVDGDFLWVYEELPATRWSAAALIGHGSLQELWPEQENRVNVRGDAGVRTLILRAGDRMQPLPATHALADAQED